MVGFLAHRQELCLYLHVVKLADFGSRYEKMIHSAKEKVYGISILLEKNADECIIIKIMCVKNVQMNHTYIVRDYNWVWNLSMKIFAVHCTIFTSLLSSHVQM